MRGRRARSFIVAAAAAALAGAVVLPASPAGATGGASMSVTPSTDLSDGDSVAVSVTGIPTTASPQLSIWECNGDASLTYAQAGSGACESLGTGNVSGGALSISVKVTYGKFTNGYDTRCDETATGHCELAAVDYPNQSVLATAPISLKAPDIGMTVTPDTGLKDGQQITVTVNPSAIPSSIQPLFLAECNMAYMAAHGGFGSGDGCYFSIAQGIAYYPFDPSKPATLNVVDGRTDTGEVACNYANNGDCAIVLLGGNDYSTVATHPITFRPTVKGPATIAASPTTGLHSGVPGKVSMTGGRVADGFSSVTLEECRPGAIDSFSGDWEYRACAQLAPIKVVDNAFVPQSFSYVEGGVGGTGSKPCDHAHPCEIGLVGFVDYGKNVLLSNWLPISFRAPNFGTPTLKLSKLRGLQGGDMVGVTATDVPDLVRALDIYECNVKGGYDKGRCHFVYSKPGDLGALIVHDNKTKGATKIRAGAVGNDSDTGKKVYCNAKTNGQCVLVAITYPNFAYRIKSAVIRFAN